MLERTCKTCKRGNEPLNVYCRVCIEKRHINWEAKEVMNEAEKACETCKHYAVHTDKEPYKTCIDADVQGDKWEAKEREVLSGWVIMQTLDKKVCETCKHEGLHSREEPCKSCIADDDTQDNKWEPRKYTKEWAEEECKRCKWLHDKGGKNCSGCNANKHRETVPYESHALDALKYSMRPDKTPGYSFNQSIIDALREGKSVWLKNDFGEWIEVKNSFPIYAGSVHTRQWSLTKPAIKTKKTIERWIRKDDIKDFEECGQYWTMSNIETREYETKITLSFEVDS